MLAVAMKLMMPHAEQPDGRLGLCRSKHKDAFRFHTIFCVALLVALIGFSRSVALNAQTLQSPSAPSQEQSLDGGDWLLGSFAIDAGVAAGAQGESFDESGFRRVQVVAEARGRGRLIVRTRTGYFPVARILKRLSPPLSR